MYNHIITSTTMNHMEGMEEEMLPLIIKLSSIALCLLVGLFVHRTKTHAKHKPQRRWMRCALCGGYQNTSQDRCVNHERPVLMLQASERLQRRIRYHLGYLWQYPHLQRQQHAFIAFVMKLEDLSGDAWSTHAAITAYESIGPCRLQKFVDFMLGIEEATGKRLDVNDIIEEFLASERVNNAKEKVIQN